ncbi:MAG: UvrB/UvrC motif-containing protein [Lachnospiraceae bacterium]|nr:UvrB/UvrC motif-containing protein [Lachnospiraceae bacterium]
MICEICHENTATIIYTEVINGKKTQRCFCDKCAALLNNSGKDDKDKLEVQVGSILSGILSKYMERYIENRTPNKFDKTVCPTCGMTFSEFMKDRLLGCPDCYGVFSMVIEKQLKTIQPGTTHVGKVPINAEIYDTETPKKPDEKKKKGTGAKGRPKGTTKKTPGGKAVETLKEELRVAVEKEDYMLAAKLRDKIKELENEKKDKKVVHGRKKT